MHDLYLWFLVLLMPTLSGSQPVSIWAVLGTDMLKLHRSAGLRKALTNFPEIKLSLGFFVVVVAVFCFVF